MSRLQPRLALSLLLLAALCASSACEGITSTDDDDTAAGDDDTAAGDDDSSAGDDDSSAGDDDTAAGDDDTSAGDDDTGAGDDDTSSSCGGLGASCSSPSECGAWQTCNTTMGLYAGVCVPDQGTCGGFAGAACPNAASPNCLYFVGADIGVCASDAERDCLCDAAPTVFGGCSSR